jgi:PAS domain S-box-containing protein
MADQLKGFDAAGIDEANVLRSLHSAYPDALLVVDRHGTIALTNRAAEELLGYSAAELLGMNVDALVPDAIRDRHAAYRQAYGEAPRARPMGTQMDLVARRKDGSVVMVEIALSPLKAEGAPMVVAAIRDIGSYPRVKQALLRARYAETLAQAGRAAVDMRDPETLLERIPQLAADALDAAAAFVLRLDADRLRLRLAGEARPAAARPGPGPLDVAAQTPAGAVLARGGPLTVSDLTLDLPFEVPAEWEAAGIRSMVGVPLFDRGRQTGVLQVLSTRVARFGDDERQYVESLANMLAAALQRAESEEALNHAQRLESVGQLTGGIAHDFNNLLTVIQGNLQVLQDLPGHAEDPARALIEAATRAARRGAELTGKLLAFSRRQVLKPTEVDVAVLLDSLSNMLYRTLDQRIRIEVETAGAPVVRADPGQLESALLNIAINARDAMPDGGVLTFACATVPVLPEALRADLDPEARADVPFATLSVRDSGCGMTDAVRERAFEPFFTTKGMGRGTGLGLSTVYGFVKQSRGTVALTSTPGDGTTVTLYIPIARPSPRSEHAPAAPTAAPPPGLRVLLVEDDAEVRRVVETFLAALECRVTACANAEEALPLIVPEARFDLLLSDISLGPGMRGTALAQQAQQALPGLRILLMSGFSQELLDADSVAPPTWELLHKPFGREELTAALARLVGEAAAD